MYCLSGNRHRGGVNLFQALMWNVRTCAMMIKGKAASGRTARVKVPKHGAGTEYLVVVRKSL